jgi:hypothetical protein
MTRGRSRRTKSRRQITPADPPRKAGWQVRTSVVQAVKEAVEEGAAESQNAFVEQALIRQLKELRRERVYAAYREAAADPVFMEEMRSTTAAFESTAADGLGEQES